MNYIREYNTKIQSGEIVACQKIKKVYERLVHELDEPSLRWKFDDDAADAIITFAEKFCYNTKGKWGGELVKLELWQKASLQAIFGFVDKETGLRKHREVFLVVARKNGKSFISSCTALNLLFADNEPGAEIYSVAIKKDQAKLVWEQAKQTFLTLKIKQPAWGKRAKGLVDTIRGEGAFRGSFFKPVGADSDRLDGLNASGVMFDEIHAQPDSKLYNVMKDSMSAREQPLMLMTTTAGFIRDGLYDEEYEYASKWLERTEGFNSERFLPLIYELDDKVEVFKEEMWVKANPSLGTLKSIESLRESVEKAKAQPSQMPNLLTKDFNLPTADRSMWLPYEAVINETVVEMEYLGDSYAIGGCDLSSTTDLTCATLLICRKDDDSIYILQHYFICEDKLQASESGGNDATKSREAPYRLWAEQGWLTINEGARVDFHNVTEWFSKMRDVYRVYPIAIGYDRALSGYWIPEMTEAGFVMEDIPQGSFTWSYPMKDMSAAFIDHRVVYQNNPMLRWCLYNTQVKSLNKDGIESIQPIKAGMYKRIDGMVSALNAWVVYYNKQDEYMQYVNY